MDETQLADLNDIQDFFSSVSPTEKPHSNPIDVKDFIGWCNDPRKNVSKNTDSTDEAETLGNAIVALNQLDNSELDAMESALREDTWDDWCETEWSKLKKAKKLKPTIKSMKEHPDNATFYLVLRCLSDNQKHYHFHFDEDAVAEIDAFAPFTEDENGEQVLSQQWHVLISLLAFLDVAHALSNEQHEYHCLYPYLSSFDKEDKGDFTKRNLRLEWKKWGEECRRVLQVVEVSRDKGSVKRVGTVPYRLKPMMDWIEYALTGQLASENAQ